MKTIIKLVIAVAILNAAYRVGMAEAGYYQLKDASQQLVTFGAQASVGDIQNQLLQKAAELDVPVSADDVEVLKDGLHTTATLSYTQPVEVFPNYTYPLDFQFSVDALSMSGLGANPGQRKR
jgi:hypothetical protein